VVYIAGWGRSGTTVLESVLGAYEGVFAAGELHYLWRRGLLQGRTCGCARPVRQCGLWTAVLRAAYGGDPPAPRHVDHLQRTIARVRHTRRALDCGPLPELADYRSIMQRLYRGIAEVTGARVIVDSSKRPFGAALLTRMADVDPYLLHVVRDPRAVTFSWQRPTAQPDRPVPALMRQHSPLRSTAQWLVWNSLTERVSRRFDGRWRRLRYEDFAAQPRPIVEDLLGVLGVGVEAGPFRDERTVTLPTNHTVSGNPGRFRTGDITIRTDDAWRRQLPWRARLVSATLSLPLRHRYGYP